jgi:arsenate reductase (thioredoxin)
MTLRTLSAFFALLLPVALAAPQDAKPPVPKIVFVCEHGAAKSVIAAKELEKLARERGIQVQAVARGTAPEPEIAPAVRQGLKAEGIELGNMTPVQVKPADLRNATAIVSFGPDLTGIAGARLKAEDWSATPAVSADYRAARDYIVKRVEALLDQLAAAKR